jgi:lysophospholipase L1-like esterase
MRGDSWRTAALCLLFAVACDEDGETVQETCEGSSCPADAGQGDDDGGPSIFRLPWARRAAHPGAPDDPRLLVDLRWLGHGPAVEHDAGIAGPWVDDGGGPGGMDAGPGGTDGGGPGDGSPPDAGGDPDGGGAPPDATPPDATPPDAGGGPPPEDAGGNPPPEDAGSPPDAGGGPGAGPGGGPGGGEPGPEPEVRARYLLVDAAVLARLRETFDAQATHPCEIQVVGDSISEAFNYLNPLTTDANYPDMAYAAPTHCRIFGQPSIFFDVPQTAASGMTAGWGLEGIGGWGGVRSLRYPMAYVDRDQGRQPIGDASAYPEIATIMYGTNDLRVYMRDVYPWDHDARHEVQSRDVYTGQLRAIAEWFLARGVVPVLMTMPPGTYDAYTFRPEGDSWGDRAGRPLGEVWVQSVRDLGREMHVPVLDLNRAFLDHADWMGLLPDGVHPDLRAYEEIINPAFHDAYQDLRRLVLTR